MIVWVSLILLVLVILMGRIIFEIRNIPKKIAEVVLMHMSRRVNDLEQEVKKIKNILE